MVERTKTKSRFTKGVPIGYKHDWNYSAGRWKESKVAPKTWKFTYSQSKSNRKLKSYTSGPGVGSRIHWKIDANQYALKTKPWKYKLLMKGKKKLVSSVILKRRKR